MPDQNNGVHWAIKLLVAWHAFAILAWSVPKAPPAVMNGSRSPGVAYMPLYLNDKYVRTFRPFSALVEYDELGNVESNDWARYSLLELYMLPTGFWQGWDMFAPNPADTDIWVDAIVIYQDGTREIFPYPRMKTLNVFMKYIKERYRKYRENLSDDRFSWKWPDVARRIAYLSYENPDNPPAEVLLRRHWMQVQPPGDPPWPEYRSTIFYKHHVDLSRIREHKDL